MFVCLDAGIESVYEWEGKVSREQYVQIFMQYILISILSRGLPWIIVEQRSLSLKEDLAKLIKIS